MQSPRQFCESVLLDYEGQWQMALGHQQRHPLRVKMERLKEMLARDLSTESFERQLEEGASSDDSQVLTLYLDLQARWQAALSGTRR